MIINGYYVHPMLILMAVTLVSFFVFLFMLYSDGVFNHGGTITGKIFEDEEDEDEVEYEGD